MALVDDLKAATPTEDLSRRKTLGILSGTGLAIAGLGTTITVVQYLRPNVLFEPPTRVRIGRPEDIALGTLLVLPDQKLYVVHTPGGFIAMSSVCTHLGCMTRYVAGEQRIFCPCHGSQYDLGGKVTGGPAPRPLVRKQLTVEQGQLVVDLRKDVGEDFVLKA